MNISLRKFRSNGSKSSVAQQLVEFLLVAPLMIIILGILLEYAYALSINMTLAQGLKQSTSIIYGQIKPAMTQAEITTLVQATLAAIQRMLKFFSRPPSTPLTHSVT